MHKIQAEELRGFATALLERGGFRPDQAAQTADLLVWANLRGIDSHGVLRIPRYVEMVEQGDIVAADPQTAHEFGAIAILDGNKCPGVVGMTAAATAAARLARVHGVGWAAIRNTSHCGAIGYFTATLAEQGLVAIGMSASKPLMAYHGARGEALSTNPLSIAIPTQDGSSLVLDMSTAAVALGKIMAAKDAGREIPEGWGVDAEGKSTTDPAKVAAVLPMAGPKGSGLSLMIEMLASVLPGAPVIAPALLGRKGGGLNGTVVALAPDAFGDAEAFAAAVTELAGAVHGLEPVEPGNAVLLPGERGAMQQSDRQVNGIPVNPGTAGRLRKLAGKLGCSVPEALAG
jgi:ureidoglycolate dehydrogenase (NAD+)